MTHQPLPSGATDADRFARALALLRGPEIQPGDGTLVAEDLRVLGGLLADARSAVLRAVAQAHPGRATDLLADLESEYGLADGSTLSTVQRQQRLLAKYRARNDGSAPALLTTLRTLAPEATMVLNSFVAVLGTDPTAVFRFAVLLSVEHQSDAALLAALDALLGQQAPAYVAWNTGVALDFRFDRADSLVERDLLAY